MPAMTLKQIALTLLLVGLALTGCRAETPLSPEAAIARVRPSVVLIEAQSGPDQVPQIVSSGLVLDTDGHVLTGMTLVAGPERLAVRSFDGRRYAAERIGDDPLSGLALLNVGEGVGLSPLDGGESTAVRAGQPVMAFGASAGLPLSVRGGRVSAVDRILPPARLETFIQLDVAARPRLDGAVVMTEHGTVLGILARPAGWPVVPHDLPLAVPLARAREIADQLRDRGRVTRGWLGAVVADDTDASAAPALGVPVIDIVAGSPAAEFGLRRGDRLLRVGTVETVDANRFNAIVARHSPGDVVALALLRDGREVAIRVELADVPQSESPLRTDDGGESNALLAAPAQPTEQAAQTDLPGPSGPDRLGLQVATLSDTQRGAIPLLGGGVRIAAVVDGPALRAGLRVNDLLLQLNGQTVNTVERYAEVVERLTPGASVPVLVQRRDAPLFVTLDLGE
jgi:serine protease Do